MLKHFLFLSVLIAPFPSFAADIAAVSDITAVTVFPDRANVERKAKFALPAGKNTIVFDNLPSGLITDSVRVSGKGQKSFTIGSVETKHVFQSNPAVKEEEKLQNELTRLRDKRKYLEADIKAAQTGTSFLEALSRSPAMPLPAAKSPETKNGMQTPALWKQGWETLQSGMKTLSREIISKQIELRTLDSEISALQQKLNMIATGRKSYKQVRVNVESDFAGEALLTLQYQIFGASWTPLYEARLDSDAQKVSITQFGNISQRTGEDWKDVALTLSTAVPTVQMTPPDLSPKWLSLVPDHPVVSARSGLVRARMKSAAMSNFAATDSLAVMAESEEAADYEAAQTATANVEAGEFSGVFAVKGRSNVPADGAEYRFTIGDYVSDAQIRAQSVPSKDPSAYLIATTSYNGELPLLPGAMSLYRDGAFIGVSQMELLRPNEKLHLSFGQDDKIRVKFTVLGGEKTQGGMIAKETKIDSLERTEIQNLHGRPISIAVYELLPVSKDADITVSIIKDKTTKGYVKDSDNKVGTLKWESVYAPKEKKTIDFGYSVSYPKNAILSGM